MADRSFDPDVSSCFRRPVCRKNHIKEYLYGIDQQSCFTAAVGVLEIGELGVRIGQLSHGTWGNRRQSVLQAISAQNSTHFVAPGPGTSHTADFRNGGRHCSSWSCDSRKNSPWVNRVVSAGPSRLGQIGVHSVHTRRTLSQSQPMPNGHFIPDEYTLSSPWVNTNGRFHPG